MVNSLSAVLRRRGTGDVVAVLASLIALACYQIAGRNVGTAHSLTQATRAAFDEALTLGSSAW